MSAPSGAQLVKQGVYEPPGRRQRKRLYLKLCFLPPMLALYLFSPGYKLGKPDHVIERAHRWRTVLAVVIGFSTLLPYIGAPQVEQVGSDMLSDLFTTGMFLIPLFLVACGILVGVTNYRQRADTLRELRRPLGAMGAFLLTYVIFGTAMGFGLIDKMTSFHPLVTLLIILALFWYIVFLISSAFLAARHLFNAVDGNMLLPPIFTTVVAWWQIIQRLIFRNEFKPLWLDLLLAFGAALVMTSLSLWEIRRLAQRGISFRSGPYPPVPVPPPPPIPQPYPPYPPPGPYPVN
ncbi:hypothetical protein [Fodinicola acaciae]|uniref:hypothetical protein n=1 Tax=Fodinicola acaciae TaxID=2681555 RepID=UPI0013D69AAE|nr:hypothetical protein [Fodinicola acaciae]